MTLKDYPSLCTPRQAIIVSRDKRQKREHRAHRGAGEFLHREGQLTEDI